MFEEKNNFDINQDENFAPQEQIPVAPYNPYIMTPEQYEKRKNIRRLGLIIGIPAIFLSLIGYIWSFAYFLFTTKVAKMTLTQAIELSENPAMQQIFQIFLSCLMFLVPFTISAKCARVRLDSIIQFGKAKKGTFFPFLFFGIGFCSFSNIAMSYASQLFQNFDVEYHVDFGEDPQGIFGFLLSFIATAIVPALVEEFACRGIVLGLLRKHGDGFAIITSSIIFGVMHGNFEQIPFAIMVGLILGYVYIKTESIWPCILIHCVNNSISVIFSYLPTILGVELQNILYILYLIVSLLAAVIGILLFSKSKDENYEIERKDDIVTEKSKYIWFFTSWAIILFAALNIYEALGYFI